MRMTAHPTQDSPHLMVYSRHANAETLSAYYLHLHLSGDSAES